MGRLLRLRAAGTRGGPEQGQGRGAHGAHTQKAGGKTVGEGEKEEREVSSNAEGLALYQYRGCPFCMRVEHAVARLGVEIELRDTLRSPERARELIEATGHRTVPVLRIDEPDGEVRWLPESADIIAYLEERFG